VTKSSSPKACRKNLKTFGCFEADMGVSGISIMFTIHFGGKSPIFGNTQCGKQHEFGTVGQNLILSLKEAGV